MQTLDAPPGFQKMSLGFQALLERHSEVLKEHMKFCALIKSELSTESKALDTAQQCMDRTQQMIQHFEQLATALNHSELLRSKNDSNATYKPEVDRNIQDDGLAIRSPKRKYTEDNGHTPHTKMRAEVVEDSSHLFTIDSNPTPVEQLLSRASLEDAHSRPAKRVKKSKKGSETRPDASAVDARDNSQASVHQTNPHSARTNMHSTLGLESETGPDGEKADDSFIAKVKKRFQEKEEKRIKKQDKKRKRQSSASVESGLIQEDSRPQKKKKRGQPDNGVSLKPDEQAGASAGRTRKRSSKPTAKSKRHKQA